MRGCATALAPRTHLPARSTRCRLEVVMRPLMEWLAVSTRTVCARLLRLFMAVSAAHCSETRGAGRVCCVGLVVGAGATVQHLTHSPTRSHAHPFPPPPSSITKSRSHSITHPCACASLQPSAGPGHPRRRTQAPHDTLSRHRKTHTHMRVRPEQAVHSPGTRTRARSGPAAALQRNDWGDAFFVLGFGKHALIHPPTRVGSPAAIINRTRRPVSRHISSSL